MKTADSRGRIRIIGGSLRGSRLLVPESPGLRPTPDRLRETLFNWLAPWIEGARCLDLFAGTGALGIEALSRGAASCQFVEKSAPLASALRANLERLKTQGSVVQTDALTWLAGKVEPFDVVFVDPPFAEQLWLPTLAALQDRGWFAEHALLYVESPTEVSLPQPEHWRLWREASAAKLRGVLYRRTTD